MKLKLIVIAILSFVVAVLIYALYRLELRYWKPKVIKVEKEVIRELEREITPEEVRVKAQKATVFSRVRGEDIEILKIKIKSNGERDTIFEPIFIKGINLGAAIPGSFPGDYAAKREDFLRWFKLISDAGFNAIRIYSLFPPDFYSALAEYNMRNKKNPLYLIQGIWAPVPEDEDYLNDEYTLKMKLRIEKVVDAIYGGANYYVDISQYTIAFLFGREWEPEGVLKTSNLHPEMTSFSGNFLSLPWGNPMEVWLAMMLDYLVSYEVTKYGGMHAVSFVNWLTLDPLYHWSEHIESPKVREYDNDLLVIDPSRFQRTEIMRSGFFASYHIYPYYPDFINIEYKDYTSRFGKDNFAGYLNALREATDGIPILVAEFGVPSSFGVGHFNPLGLHQGRHSERRQGEIDLMLFQDIFDEGYAGGVLFEWMDEWFKRNWLFMDFENPIHRNPLWHNIYDAEQTYGLLSFDPNVINIDGATDDWRGKIPLATGRGKIKAIYVDADPVYFYIRVDLRGSLGEGENLYIALDTYKKELGEFVFKNIKFKNGVEFIIEVGDSARVLVEESYNIFRDWIKDIKYPMRTVKGRSGTFVEASLLANRTRITLLGDTIEGKRFYPGKMIKGKQDSTSLAQWTIENGVLEMRLGWNAINVTDPSSHMVLQDDPGTPELDAVKTDGFSLAVFILDRKGNLLASLPRYSKGKLKFTKRYLWKGWDKPDYREHLKRSYYVLKEGLKYLERDSTYRKLRRRENQNKKIKIKVAPFRWGKRGAISFTFDDGGMTQFKFADPILRKYGLRGTFGIVAEWTGENPKFEGPKGEIKTLRMSKKEVSLLNERGHEIASHGYIHTEEMYNLKEDSLVVLFKKGKKFVESLINGECLTLHIPYSRKIKKVIRAAKRAGFKFLRVDDNQYNLPGKFNPYEIKSFVILSDTIPEAKELAQIFDKGEGKWTVLMYHNLFEENSKEKRLMEAHKVLHTYSVTPQNFERHVRIARNTDYYVGTLKDVASYILNAQKASLQIRRNENLIIVKLKNSLRPLTLIMEGPPGIYKVKTGASIKVFEMRLKPKLFEVSPNENVLIEYIPLHD